jgi:hypothetical protein
MGQGGEILGSEAGIDSRTYCRSANASDFRFGVNSSHNPLASASIITPRPSETGRKFNPWYTRRTARQCQEEALKLILFDLAIRPAGGWRIRGGRRFRRNRSARIFGRNWFFLPLLPLGRLPNRLKVCMYRVGDKPGAGKYSRFGTHRDSLGLISLVCDRRRKFRHIERELARRATALP